MTTTLEAIFDQCGGRAALARQLKSKRKGHGLTRQAVSMWKRVPAEHVQDVVRITGGKFTPEQLRPDIFKAAA